MASKKQKLEDMPVLLRGFSNNRWGGHQSNRIRGFQRLYLWRSKQRKAYTAYA